MVEQDTIPYSNTSPSIKGSWFVFLSACVPTKKCNIADTVSGGGVGRWVKAAEERDGKTRYYSILQL